MGHFVARQASLHLYIGIMAGTREGSGARLVDAGSQAAASAGASTMMWRYANAASKRPNAEATEGRHGYRNGHGSLLRFK